MLLNINKQFVIEFEDGLSKASNITVSDILQDLNDLLISRMDYDDNVRYRNLNIVKGLRPLEPFEMDFDSAFLSSPVCSWIETLSIKEHIELIQYVLGKISMRYY